MAKVKDKTKQAPPMAGSSIVKFDGAIFQEKSVVGIGIVVGDESGVDMRSGKGT